MKKIGLLTWHYYSNFGSQLQTFALAKFLKAMGYSPVIINYHDKKLGNRSKCIDYLKILLSHTISHLQKNKRFYYPSLSFEYKYLVLSSPFYSDKNIPKRVLKFKYYICGSDQIWAPNCFNPVYMLNFVSGAKVAKISYAASIGLNAIPNELKVTYHELLKDFKYISVREESGASLLKNECDITEAITVLDPTFLLNINEYEKIEKKVHLKCEFIFCYFLNSENEYKESVKRYARMNGLEIVGFSAKESDKNWMELYQHIGPREFLWLIHNAQCIFTDSYHGTIFSLLYHKEFYTFERFKKDDPINQNSRIYQLDKWFNIKSRIIDDQYDFCHEVAFNYEEFEKKLEIEKKKSTDFLMRALQ